MPFQIIRNDITKVAADAIVNTANPHPRYGGGTDNAIYQAAGPEELLAERRKIGDIATGEVAVTPAFRLPARYIIHTVGPSWQGGSQGEYKALASCYRKSLLIARQLGCESIAFPLISTGVYGFPKDRALKIALETIEDFLNENDMEVTLVVFDKKAFDLSSSLTADVAQFIDENYVEQRREEEYKADIPYGGNYGSPRQRETLLQRIRGRRQDLEEIERRPSLFSRRRKSSMAEDLEADQEYLEDDLAADWADLEEDYAPKESAPSAPAPAAPAAAAPSAPKPSASAPEPVTSARIPSAPAPSTPAPAHPVAPAAPAPTPSPSTSKAQLNKALKHMEESFQERLLHLIDERQLTDVQVYKKANVDRKLFSKIRCNPQYSPRKQTAVALSVALELNLEETRDLLGRAGFALSPSSKFDLIVEYCIVNHIYSIYDINSLLFEYDQPMLG